MGSDDTSMVSLAVRLFHIDKNNQFFFFTSLPRSHNKLPAEMFLDWDFTGFFFVKTFILAFRSISSPNLSCPVSS